MTQRLRKPDRDLTAQTSRSASITSHEILLLHFRPSMDAEELIVAILSKSKPISMHRAKTWSPEKENATR